MIIAVHQPNYLPYLGFFDKMQQSDVFVIYDDAQFSKEDFQHRNKIRIFHDWTWLTVPVEKERMPIKDIRIRNELKTKDLSWADHHLSLILENYQKSKYFEKYEPELRRIYSNKYNKLVDINLELISFIKEAFNINTEIVLSSEMGFTSKSTKRLVEIVTELGGDTYLSGAMGIRYLEESLFSNKGINVMYQYFEHPVYKQVYPGFVPNMSAIDSLFNMGKEVLPRRPKND